MKLAIIFLVCFTVSLSYQQRGFRFFPAVPSQWYYYYNRPAAPALGFHDFLSNNNNQYANDVFDNYQIGSESGYNSQEEDLIDSGIQARTPSRKVNFGSSQQQRFLLSGAYFNNLFNLPIITSTDTVTMTVPAVQTVASIQSCIGISQFRIIVDDNKVQQTLTTACATSRRRRDVGQNFQDKMEIEPSKMEPLEVSLAPKTNRADVIYEPEIFSSQEFPNEHLEVDDVSESAINRQKRRLSTVHVTVTSTLTSYSFTTTIVKKTFSLGIPGAPPAAGSTTGGGGLVCLPAGYTVC